jgi:hypothetical protein
MYQLKDKIYETVINDSELISLLNITEEETRVATTYPSDDILYNDITPALLIYGMVITRRSHQWSYPNQTGNAFLYFRINSIDKMVMENIAERLIVLFDKSAVESDNWIAKTSMLNGSTEKSPEGSPSQPIYILDVSFRLSNIFSK